MKRFATTVAAAGMLLVPAAAASAHAEVSHLTPKPGSTVASSTPRVSLRFSEAVVGATLKVTDASGRTVSHGSALARGGTRLRAALSLHAGRITVRAAWLADDGDTQRKIWHFQAR